MRWFLLTLLGLTLAVSAEEPALPIGLGPVAATPATEPALPVGLGASPSAEPALPTGLVSSQPEDVPLAAPRERLLPEELSGFWEARAGARLQNAVHEKEASIGETRLQLQLDTGNEQVAFKGVADFLYDPVLNDNAVDLEDGSGWFDLRQANVLLRPANFMDLKIGRQINTWGTGDLLFINDLFPKDWNSFFIGRDDEYLKAPSDSIKTAFFSEPVNLDLIYSPRFDSDRYIDGRRISYWNNAQGRLTGRDAVVDADQPDEIFSDDEWAARLYRNWGAYEVAAYGYDGFWKSPAGMNPQTGEATFPRLQVFGASIRGPLARGIANAEGGWYRSADDLSGDDPYIRNSESRFLAGYEQELMRNLTGGVQYYVERMSQYGAYRRTLPPGSAAADEYRQVVTIRLTRLLMN